LQQVGPQSRVDRLAKVISTGGSGFPAIKDFHMLLGHLTQGQVGVGLDVPEDPGEGQLQHVAGFPAGIVFQALPLVSNRISPVVNPLFDIFGSRHQMKYVNLEK